jgi:wyosine [tRNA(Phe)-imidazoG37] synthetase (radical SAM superfamily)
VTGSGFRHVYGPVPSRRLGRSLGIDLVPYKICTYDCVYCQLGRTTNRTVERKEYVAIDETMAELEQRLADKDAPDYITLSGSGEPTLNSGVGGLIRHIKELTDIPAAVLTNGSLLWMRDVQDELMAADLVIPSLDAGDEDLFHYVNRPHSSISFDQMTDGIAEFTRRFKGQVWLEVLLLGGVTGIPAEVEKIAAAARRIGPTRVQLSTVFRPPAEEFAFPVDQDQLERLQRFFSGAVEVEVVREGRSSPSRHARDTATRDEAILALLRRRPCTIQDVAVGLNVNSSEVTKRLHALVQQQFVSTVRRDGVLFYRA